MIYDVSQTDHRVALRLQRLGHSPRMEEGPMIVFDDITMTKVLVAGKPDRFNDENLRTSDVASLLLASPR
jgi:hypothetical protein